MKSHENSFLNNFLRLYHLYMKGSLPYKILIKNGWNQVLNEYGRLVVLRKWENDIKRNLIRKFPHQLV